MEEKPNDRESFFKLYADGIKTGRVSFRLSNAKNNIYKLLKFLSFVTLADKVRHVASHCAVAPNDTPYCFLHYNNLCDFREAITKIKQNICHGKNFTTEEPDFWTKFEEWEYVRKYTISMPRFGPTLCGGILIFPDTKHDPLYEECVIKLFDTIANKSSQHIEILPFYPGEKLGDDPSSGKIFLFILGGLFILACIVSIIIIFLGLVNRSSIFTKQSDFSLSAQNSYKHLRIKKERKKKKKKKKNFNSNNITDFELKEISHQKIKEEQQNATDEESALFLTSSDKHSVEVEVTESPLLAEEEKTDLNQNSLTNTSEQNPIQNSVEDLPYDPPLLTTQFSSNQEVAVASAGSLLTEELTQQLKEKEAEILQQTMDLQKLEEELLYHKKLAAQLQLQIDQQQEAQAGEIEKQMGALKNEIERLNSQKNELRDKVNAYKKAFQEKVKTMLPMQNISPDSLQEGEKLGEGNFAAVYKGFWYAAPVAIKKIKNAHFSSEALESFNKEIKISLSANFPHVVKCYGISGPDLSPSIIMEYCPGGSLDKRLQNSRDKSIAWQQRGKWAYEIAMGLAYLHEQNILHCDLACRNVLLDATGTAKLADFGLAKVKRYDHSNQTVLKSVKYETGDIAIFWMAPEFLHGKKANIFTTKTDIFSYGILLWELATYAEPPFKKIREAGQQWQLSREESAQKIYHLLIEELVTNNYRDPIPADTPLELKQQIEACQQAKAKKRPSANTIVKNLYPHFGLFSPHYYPMKKKNVQEDNIPPRTLTTTNT